VKRSYIVGLVTIATLTISWIERPKIFDYYNQLTKIREPLTEDLRDNSQLKASFVGSAKCMECHEEQYHSWKVSRHSKMIQDVDNNSSVLLQTSQSFQMMQILTLGSDIPSGKV